MVAFNCQGDTIQEHLGRVSQLLSRSGWHEDKCTGIIMTKLIEVREVTTVIVPEQGISDRKRMDKESTAQHAVHSAFYQCLWIEVIQLSGGSHCNDFHYRDCNPQLETKIYPVSCSDFVKAFCHSNRK